MEKQFWGADFGILQDACGILWALSTKKEEDMEMSPQPPPVRSCVTVIDADAYLKFLQEVFGDLPVVLAFFFGQEVSAGELTEFNWFPQTKGCILGCVDDNLDWGNKNTYQHQTLESR